MNSERLHALDSVRAFAMLGGVVLHATLSFLPGFGTLGFPIPDRTSSVTLAVVYYVIHMSRMTTFFFVTGFFGHLLLHRLGRAGFIWNRSVRILIPFVVGWFAIYPASTAAFVWATSSAGVSLGTLPWPALSLRNFPLMHLWFLYILILGYGFTLLARAALVRIDSSGAMRARGDAWLGALVRGPFFLIAMAAPTTLALVFYAAGWRRWLGVPTPDKSLIPQIAAVVSFGSAFTLGWFLNRQTELLTVWEKRWPLHLLIGLVTTGVCLSLVGLEPRIEPAVPRLELFVYAASYTIGAWAWTTAVIGVALRFFNQRSAVRRYLADASYWIYLVHQPLLFFLQAAVMDLPWHWSIKFFVILTIALAVLFASYHLLVRDTVLGAILNGRRQGRDATPPAVVGVRPSIV
jgi:glucans biosynthesis protein C